MSSIEDCIAAIVRTPSRGPAPASPYTREYMGDGPHAVILAAGQGKRMRSALPKVLHPLGGRPLLLYVVDAVRAATGSAPVVVIARGRHRGSRPPRGRRHMRRAGKRRSAPAMRCGAFPSVDARSGPVLVTHGDAPLIRAETFQRLLAAHASSPRACTLLLGIPADPSGMGRVVRDADGHVLRIVEEADLPPGEPVPMECNAGVYVFDGAQLWPALDRLGTANAQGEYYLTDVVALLTGPVEGVVAPDPDEVLGINDRRQLAAAEAVLRRRDRRGADARRGHVRGPGDDLRRRPGGRGQGQRHPRDDLAARRHQARRRVRDRPDGHPHRRPRGRRGGRRAVPSRASANSATASVVGSYCRVRPNTVLASGVELGTHAEVKNSTVGAGTRISHFSCVLDSDVGEAVNIGAGTVTCNYDGEAKHRTTIGNRVFVGTNSTLVAPVRLGDGLLHRRRLVRRPGRARRRARRRPEPAAQHRGMGGPAAAAQP